jgi:hypothetical protein
MKHVEFEVHCPLCHEVMEYDNEICIDCDAWGKANGVNLKDRLHDDYD